MTRGKKEKKGEEDEEGVALFVRTAMQLRVHVEMTELAEWPVPAQELASRVLVEKINAEIGGRCHENKFVRRGKQFFELTSWSLPELEGADMIFTVQFLCDTFTPGTSAAEPRVFAMRVDQVVPLTSLSENPMLECSWPDPETGEVAMRAYVLSDDDGGGNGALSTASISVVSVGDIVRVSIGDVKAEMGERFLKAMGRIDGSGSGGAAAALESD